MSVAIDSGSGSGSGPSDRLVARDIHVRRGNRCILQAVDLSVAPGRLLALVGPNGAGKSSLLNVLAGLLVPSHGHVTLDDRPLDQWSPTALARRRAMLSQQVHLDFAFNTNEVVMLGRSPHPPNGAVMGDQGIVEAALRDARAWELRGRNYLDLSGGEQQRVQLARVLAQVWEQPDGPSWVLLDEPEAGLDIAHQHFVLEHARALTRQGYGVITVLHDLNLAARYADDVALLAQGRLLHHGSPAYALDPHTLSTVYGLPLRRITLDDDEWILVPSRSQDKGATTERVRRYLSRI
jgi:iron complex transport system ATP-binding protein